MSFAAKKSDVKNHLSRHVTKHVLSPDPTSLPDDTGATEEGKSGSNLNTSISGIDSGQRPSSEGIFAPNEVVVQR